MVDIPDVMLIHFPEFIPCMEYFLTLCRDTRYGPALKNRASEIIRLKFVPSAFQVCLLCSSIIIDYKWMDVHITQLRVVKFNPHRAPVCHDFITSGNQGVKQYVCAPGIKVDIHIPVLPGLFPDQHVHTPAAVQPVLYAGCLHQVQYLQ